MMRILKSLLSLFKRDVKPNKMYKCFLVREGVLAIISSLKYNESIDKYNINPIKNGKLICELAMKELPLSKEEKKLLAKTQAIYFYNEQNNKVSSFNDIYEKIRNIKK